MRKLIIPILIAGSLEAAAQEDNPALRILAVDSNTTVAKAFNNAISQAAGLSLAIVDSTQPHSLLCIYKGGNETLRSEYRYSIKADENEPGQGAKQAVDYQRITATAYTMGKVFSYLFNTNVDERVLNALVSNGSGANYHGGSYIYSLQQDDMRPGYWVLTFMR